MDYTKDYYAILGILSSADEAIIKAVYRALAKKWHPDTFAGDKLLAERKLKEINEAYGVLSNKSSRADYDARRNASAGQQREYEEPDAEERAPFEAELASDWRFVLEYYPAVERMREELVLFSNVLALTFQVRLLETKAFAQAGRVKQDLLEQFLRMYFGSTPAIQEFAARLIRTGNKAGAKELNRLIRVSGSPSPGDAERIILRLTQKYPDQQYQREPDRGQSNSPLDPSTTALDSALWVLVLTVFLSVGCLIIALIATAF